MKKKPQGSHVVPCLCFAPYSLTAFRVSVDNICLPFKRYLTVSVSIRPRADECKSHVDSKRTHYQLHAKCANSQTRLSVRGHNKICLAFIWDQLPTLLRSLHVFSRAINWRIQYVALYHTNQTLAYGITGRKRFV